MAVFVVNLGISPAEYYGLTWAERTAIITAYNKAQRRH